MKNASLFRGEVLSVAGEVLRAMRRLERGVGRMTGERVGKAVKSVLRAWEEWSVFGEGEMKKLRRAFENSDEIGIENSESENEGESESGSGSETTDSDIDGEPWSGDDGEDEVSFESDDQE